MIYIQDETAFIGIPPSSVSSISAIVEKNYADIIMSFNDGTRLVLGRDTGMYCGRVIVRRMLEAIEQGKELHIRPNLDYRIGAEKYMFDKGI